jgi:hypothetical protein
MYVEMSNGQHPTKIENMYGRMQGRKLLVEVYKLSSSLSIYS